MTEAEWNACTSPGPMLEFLRGKASDRKLRLFAFACCRTIWPVIPAVFREAIEVAEEHSDGYATDAELGAAVSAAHRARGKRKTLHRAVYDAVRSNGDAASVAEPIARVVANAAAPDPSPTFVSRFVGEQVVTEEIPPNAARLKWNAEFASHLALEASILRDIVGPLPFRTVSLDPTWCTSTVKALAQAVYEERDFNRFPILADALEDAGCSNAEILDHCRRGGEHSRGCWALDLVLGKE